MLVSISTTRDTPSAAPAGTVGLQTSCAIAGADAPATTAIARPQTLMDCIAPSRLLTCLPCEREACTPAATRQAAEAPGNPSVGRVGFSATLLLGPVTTWLIQPTVRLWVREEGMERDLSQCYAAANARGMWRGRHRWPSGSIIMQEDSIGEPSTAHGAQPAAKLAHALSRGVERRRQCAACAPWSKVWRRRTLPI